MSPRLGLSSGSAPGLDARELAALVRRAGGAVADLRAGKGHRWEKQGIEGLGGLPVSFVGISVVLGEPDQDTGQAARFPGRSIKVFAAPGVGGAEPAAAQIAALARDRGTEQILVETHRGGAGPDELAALCARHGCRLVLDNLGLAEITGDFAGALRKLAPWTAAVQVKGFDPAPGPGARPVHRPLAGRDLGWLRAFVAAPIDITVESRSGTPLRDLATLRDAWRAVECA
ncbi:hypothetical protein [Actinomadura macra]|uniref:hypothetical protein n=1 Tax=Actinomadura macra TaxID=46164 RepID=UPI000834BB51|nr:hypothetical protein [Actinomadura macra]